MFKNYPECHISSKSSIKLGNGGTKSSERSVWSANTLSKLQQGRISGAKPKAPGDTSMGKSEMTTCPASPQALKTSPMH